MAARALLLAALLATLLVDAGADGLLGLKEGESCDANGVEGTCLLWYRCLTMIADHFQNELDKYPKLCSFEGDESIVCCTSCDAVDDIRDMVVDTVNGGILYKTKQKSWNKCIDYHLHQHYQCRDGFSGGVQKVYKQLLNCHEISDWTIAPVGGKDAKRGEFPHMALLGYGETDLEAEYWCGGSVISEWFILTAGHCLSAGRRGDVKFVALGILRRSDPPRLWQRYRVAAAIPHPEYAPPLRYHDIALLKTNREIVFSRSVKPACLPKLETEVNMTGVVAAGWGRTGYKDELANTLQRVTLTKLNAESCQKQYKDDRKMPQGFNFSTQLCYGDNDELKDTCTGDSGGPLQVPGPLVPCQPVVVGVTSAGIECGIIGTPAIYTRVEYYVPWIDSIVWP